MTHGKRRRKVRPSVRLSGEAFLGRRSLVVTPVHPKLLADDGKSLYLCAQCAPNCGLMCVAKRARARAPHPFWSFRMFQEVGCAFHYSSDFTTSRFQPAVDYSDKLPKPELAVLRDCYHRHATAHYWTARRLFQGLIRN